MKIVFRVAANVFACWAVSILWGWFFVPFGLPALRWLHVLGFDLTLAVLRGVWTSDMILYELGKSPKPSTSSDFAAAIATTMLSLVGLAFGWCVHWLLVHT